MSVNTVLSDGSLSKIATRGQFTQYSVMPTASASIVNKIVQYIGTSTASYINGYFYKCEEVSTGVYGWTNIRVQAGGSGGGAVDSVNGKTGTVILDAKDIGLQYDTMPTASAIYENQIVQYTGTTDVTYTNGYFYKCVEDGGVYSWILVADFALASDVYTKTQVGALTDLPDTSKNIVQNIDAINTAVGDKADKVSSATNGDLAGLDSNGDLTDSGILATNVVQKSSTSGLLKNDGTVDTNTYLTSTDISNKANMVSSATNGDLAGLDSNGDLTDSGIAATNVVVKSSTAGLIKNDGSIDTNTYATTSALGDKTDKVTSATNGDLAGLDSNGNLTDSGIAASNVITKSSTVGLIKNDGTIDESSYATTAKAYLTDDTAETTLDDADYVPFYDTSATAKKKSTWANIKSVLKTYFDTIYSTIKTLSGLTDTNISVTPTDGQVLTYDGTNDKWINATPSSGGHTMTPTPSASLTRADLQTAIATAVTEGGINDDVVSAWAVGNWSNTMTYRVVYNGTIAVGDTGIGTFVDSATLATLRAESDLTAREAAETTGTGGLGWWKDSHFIIPSGYDYDIKFKYEPHENGEVVVLGGYVLDDETGCLCIKFGKPIVNTGTKIAVDIIITQNNISSSGGA